MQLPEPWRVEFYLDRHGREPVREFLATLSRKARAAIDSDIKLLQEFGTLVGTPTVRPITGVRKLWELRTKTTDGAIRIFYVAITGRKFVLLHGFLKKTNKTPPAELAIAIKRLHETLEQESDHD